MPAAIFNGLAVKILKDRLRFKGGVEFMPLSVDPTQTIVEAPIDSLGIYNGRLYVKLDSLSSTNWKSSREVEADLNTGILEGGVISIGAPNTTFSISDGNGIVVDSHTDANDPLITPVKWTGLINRTLTDLNADFTSIGIDSAGAIIQKPNGGFSSSEKRDIILLGTVVHLAHTSIEDISQGQLPAYGGLHNSYDAASAVGPINSGGNIYSANGANLNLDRSAGLIFSVGSNYAISRKAPNEVSSILDTGVTFNYNYQDGVGGFTIVPTLTALDPDFWDDGTGTLNTVANNDYSIQRVYFLPASGISIIQYGQAQYNNFNSAVRGLSTEKFIKNPALSGGAILRAFIIVQEGENDLTNATFIEADKFGQNASGGVSSSSLGASMLWRGDWVSGIYEKYDTVRDLEWTMIANKTTSERAAPTPTGNPFDVFIGDMGSDSVTAKQVIYGQRYTNTQGVFINSYRVNTVVGNSYRIFSVKDPLGAPVVNELVSFEAQSTAWTTFNIDPVLLPVSSVFDLLVVSTEPDATPTTFDGAWSYVKPNNDAIPLTGEVVQSSKTPNTINIHKTDDAAGSRGAELQALTIGDQFEMGGVNWSIQATVDNTTYMTFSVAPASQSALSGVQAFTFETVTATPLTYGFKLDHWLTNANISGLYIADGDYASIVANDNAYGIDLNVTEADISEDWDVIASGSTATTANPIVPFTAMTDWEEFTPSSSLGLGTISNVSLMSRRVGGDLEVKGILQVGTVTGSEAQLGLPDGLVIANSPSRDIVGNFGRDSASGADAVWYILATTGDSFVNMGRGRISVSTPTDALNGSEIFGNNESVRINFKVSIQGWTAQSSGTVFATDSNKEDIVVIGKGNNASVVATNDKVDFTPTSDTQGLWSESVGGNGFDTFTAPESGIYNITGMIRVSVAANMITTAYIDNVADVYLESEYTTSKQKSFSGNLFLNKDQTLDFRLNGVFTLENNPQNHWVSITRQSVNVDNLIVENFGTVVAASTLGTGELENVFSARIANNGTASVTSFNQDFIQSVTRSALGKVDVVFVAGFFTVTPSVTMTPNDPANSDRWAIIKNLTVSGFRADIQNVATFIDDNFSFTATRQGTDYKSKANYIDSLIIENPDGEFETTEKILSGNVTATADISEFTTALDPDFDYLLTGNFRHAVPNGTTQTVNIKNGPLSTGNTMGQVYISYSGAVQADQSKPISLILKKEEHLGMVYFYYNGQATILGNGAKSETFIQLTKLPKKLGVDQLGQVVTNHIVGGTEYELKGQLWNGAQIYARSWDFVGSIPSNTQHTIGTAVANLLPIDIEGTFQINSTGNWYSLESALTNNTADYTYYNTSTGDILFRKQGDTVDKVRFTLKYTKP